MNILSVSHLTKKFNLPTGGFTAVNNISFELKEGEILGLLGPNGAGKTTTIQMLLGIIIPTAGSIHYFAKDFFRHRQYCLGKINYASAFNTLQGRTTVMENLLVFSELYAVADPKKKILELLEYFEMTALANERYWDLSSGERTRINLIKSLLNDPQLILMDEPTASLDPDIADKTMSLIEKLKKDKRMSILFTSHNMAEVTRICDRVIFLDRGDIVAQDTPLGLTKSIKKTELQLTFDTGKDLIQQYVTEHSLKHNFINGHVVVIQTAEKQIPKVIFGISKKGVWMTDIEVRKPTLEDVFLQIARGKPHEFTKD